MLPVESLVDIVAFFKYFDLGSLLLTNKQLLDLARQVVDKIRIQDLSGFDLVVVDNGYYYTYVRDAQVYGNGVHPEHFTDEGDMAEFLSEAFRHCVVGNMKVIRCNGRVLNALRKAARTIIVMDTLTIEVAPSSRMEEVVAFVATFQRVKKLTINLSRRHPSDPKDLFRDLTQIDEVCQQKNIDWTQHWMST